MNFRNAAQPWRLILVAMTAAIFLFHAPLALGQSPEPQPEDPNVLELETPYPAGDEEEDEEALGEERDDSEEATEAPYPERDGATARRELLFRDGLYERERRYPKGLEPRASVERSDIEAFDARYRGQNAQLLSDVPPGLTVNGSLQAGFQIDDNPLLESSEESAGRSTEVWGYLVEPRVAVTRRARRTLFQGSLRLPYEDLNSLGDDAGDSTADDLGSFDQYAGFQLDIVGREDAFNVFTNIANATTRTAIVLDTGTGLSDRRTLTFGGGGSYKHTLTPNSVVQISASARRQDFGTDGFTLDTLEDSTFFQIAGDYRTLITASDRVGIGAVYEQFLPDGPFQPNVDIITALVNWSRDVRANMSIRLEAGAQIIDGDSTALFVESQSTVSPFVDATLYWAITNQDSFAFGIGHSAEPSGTGDIRTNTRVRLDYRREVTRELSFGIPLLVIVQNSTLDNGFDSRTYFQVAPNLAWAFGTSWGVTAEYRFRLDNESDRSAALSNAAFVSLTYFGLLYP